MDKFAKFVQDRHKAFADVLYNDSLKELRKYCKKYGIPMQKNNEIAKAGVYKAIQYCTDFTDEEKDMALVKCLELGFSPLIDWRERRANEKT